MSSKSKRIISLFLSVLMVVSIMAVGFVTAHAEINDAVRKDANGIFEIRSRITVSGTYVNPLTNQTSNLSKVDFGYYSGTCFLINNTTVLTCAHVVNPDQLKDDIYTDYGLTVDNIIYQLVINKDVVITCTLKNLSAQDDYAILTLNEAIGGKDILKLGDSSKAVQTQRVYALGFPGNITQFQMSADSKNVTYDKDDVTITEGEIQKVTNINNTDVIQHGCVTSNGNSGGPIVDENGNVLGIHKWGLKEDNSYHYATAINEVKKVLDSLMIEYTSDDSPAVTTTAPAEDNKETEAPTEKVTEAKSDIQPTTEAKPAEEGNDMMKIIIIIAIVVLVIIIAVVVILIIVNSKKKNGPKNPPQAGPTAPAPKPPVQQPPYAQPQYNRPPTPTAPSNEGAGETSVLNDGAGETTVLGGGGQAPGFTMIRKKNNERISIGKPEFLIGKERRRVDYCIADNNSISRAHAKIKVRGGRAYISDLGSTNCTYVNGVKLSPNQEVILSKGDKIKISDEEFEFIG